MSTGERSFSPQGAGFGDQAVDVQRYFDALRRNGRTIIAIAVAVTVVVFVFTHLLPKTYRASSTVVYNPNSTVLQPTDATSTERQLATFQTLAQTAPVLFSAARSLHEPASKLKGSISATVDPKANIITIAATAPRPALAAARANAVARAFLSVQQSAQNAGLNGVRNQLDAQISQLRGTPGAASQIAALQERINALQINAAGVASQLQVGETAAPPASASSPRPTLDAIVALFVALLLSVLVVLGRDQLRPRFATPRELARGLNLPVLVGLPYRPHFGTERRRRALSAVEHEAFDVLQASVRLLGSAHRDQRVILVTGATHGEGKTTVAAGLARAMAHAGQKVLVMSGDVRSPTLHEHFALPSQPGLSECLKAADRSIEALMGELDNVVRTSPEDVQLDVLPAGAKPSNPSSLLSSSALQRMFEALRQTDYDYVVVDSPPIPGLSDTQFLARQADDVLLVARLDRVRPENVEDVNELLKRLKLSPIGVVVVGARAEISPYYFSEDALAEPPEEVIPAPLRARAIRRPTP